MGFPENDNELLPLESEVNREKAYPTVFSSTLANYMEDIAQVQADLIAGLLIYYVPRDNDNPQDINHLLGEIEKRNYTTMYKMKVWADDPTYIQTNADIFNKFGFQIQDECTLWVSRREFRERLTGGDKRYWVEESRQNDVEPRIGDLFFVPMVDSLFEVTWAEDHENMIYGYKSFWKVVAKKYKVQATDSVNVEKIDDESEEREAVVDEINDAVENAQKESTDISLDPTQTGFDETTTDSINDDVAKEVINILDPSDLEDSFGSF